MKAEVYDCDGELLIELDTSDMCGAMETGDLCGGCDRCLLEQAEQSGYYEIRYHRETEAGAL